MVTRRAQGLQNEQQMRVASAAGADALCIALVKGWEERSRIREALKHRLEVLFVDRISDAKVTLKREERPIAGLVVEHTDMDGRATADFVREVRTTLSHIPIVGYARLGVAESAGIRALAAAGVHELMFFGVDDRGVAFRSLLSAAAHACAAEAVLLDLRPHLPEVLHAFATFCIRHPGNAHTVGEVAVALGLNRRTFVNYCARAHMCPPAELLGWCRLLLAAHYLTTTIRTVEAIALQLDFPSDTALRNMMKRYTGLRASEIRSEGGVNRVLGKMLDSFAAHSQAQCEAKSVERV